jgi:hypothetical protein
MLIAPTAAVWDQVENCSYLTYAGDDHRALTGYYHTRGAVCWPGSLQRSTTTQIATGYFCLLATNRRTLITYLVGLLEFQSAATILGEGPDNMPVVRFRGVAGWLSDVQRHYACTTFYWIGDPAQHYRWAGEIGADPMVGKRPTFIEIRWDDPRQAIMQVIQWLNTGRLKLPPAETLATALERQDGTTLRSRLSLANQHLDTPDPDVWAVAVAVSGLAAAMPGRMG